MELRKRLEALRHWLQRTQEEIVTGRQEGAGRFSHGPTTICRCCYEPEAPGPGEVCAACMQIRTMNESEMIAILTEYEREVREYLSQSKGQIKGSTTENGRRDS